MWEKMKVRVISGVVGAILVIAAVFAPVVVFNVIISIACLFSLYELYMTFKLEKKWQIIVLDYVFALLIMATSFITHDGYARGIFTLILVSYLMLLLICAILWNGKITFYDVASSFFMLIYSVLFLYHMTLIRMMDQGVVLIFLPLLGAWMPDTFAYFSGLLFGKHKLIPSISPNKTVEGAIGAVIGCVVMFLLYGFVVQNMVGLSVSFPALIVLSVLCGVIAQFGDLAASLLKRECHAKDFGNLIPGHGGIMDRIDSLIFVAPLVYYFILYFPVIS